MTAFERARRASAAAGAAAAGLLGGVAQSLATDASPFGVRLVIALVVTALATPLAIALIDRAFAESSRLRRALLRDWFVEGRWVEIAEFDGQTLFAVVDIVPRGFGIEYTGQNYDEDGRPVGRFESTLVGVSNSTLMSHGTTWGFPSATDGLEWYCTLTFGAPQGGIPLHYAGEYKFMHRQHVGRFAGVRVVASDDLRGLAEPARFRTTLSRLTASAKSLLAS